MHKKLRRIPLPPEIQDRLKLKKFETAKDILAPPEYDLIKILDLTHPQIQQIISVVSQACMPQEITAANLRRKQETMPSLKTTLSPLDYVLHGGIPPGSITEILGPPGAGKTQFCHLSAILALVTCLGDILDSPEKRGSVLYFDTESAFSPDRIREIAAQRFPYLMASEQRVIALLQRIRVFRIQSSQDLLTQIENLEALVVETGARLIVLDSIASIMRSEFDNTGFVQRQITLTREASMLKFIAETFNIPVIVTNQITISTLSSSPAVKDKVEDLLEDQKEEEAPQDQKRLRSQGVTAALGVIWAHSVNTRLVLEFVPGDASGVARQLTVAKSPMAPVITFPYVIAKEGLVLAASDDRPVLNTDNYWSGAVTTRTIGH